MAVKAIFNTFKLLWFTYTINLPSQHRFNRICLTRIILPKSWYTVHIGQNTFVLNEGKQSVTIVIPPANYNRRSFALVCQQALSAASPNGFTYEITFPNYLVEGDDGKYTIKCSNTEVSVSIQVPD